MPSTGFSSPGRFRMEWNGASIIIVIRPSHSPRVLCSRTNLIIGSPAIYSGKSERSDRDREREERKLRGSGEKARIRSDLACHSANEITGLIKWIRFGWAGQRSSLTFILSSSLLPDATPDCWGQEIAQGAVNLFHEMNHPSNERAGGGEILPGTNLSYLLINNY